MKCALCKETLEEENPETVVGLNPKSFRKATMHLWCLKMELEELENLPAKDPLNYLNRRDEYDQKVYELSL